MGQLEKVSHMPRLGARQIYETLREQIMAGVFATNGLLPSSRALAHELGVSRTTVTVAYEQLLAEGFIDVRQGARPRVISVATNDRTGENRPASRRPPHLSAYGERLRAFPVPPAQPEKSMMVDFRYGDLASADFPTALWKRAVNATLGQPPERLTYNDARGSRRLRLALQGYLWRARTIRCALEQIIVVTGSQQGLDLCARLLLDPTDTFIVEEPGYIMARRVFASTGATLAALPVDHDGIKTDRIAEMHARLAYVTPSHQFPLGSVLPIARRQQLLEWARNQHAYIIEDDYDSEYRYDISPVPPLYGLAGSDHVIYLGTISKTLSPTLRIGYLVVPLALSEIFATAKQLMDRHSPLTEQEALAWLIESGGYDTHVRRARRNNSERRATLLNALRAHFGDDILIEGAEAGLHVVVWFKRLPADREFALLEAAQRVGLGVYPITPLYTQASHRPNRVGLIMGYAALDAPRIEKGIRWLGSVVDQLILTSPSNG